MDLIVDYLTQVGQMLEDGNFSEAKREAKKIETNFNLTHGFQKTSSARTSGQTPFELLGLADLDTRHKHESESEWCQAHHVRNPNDGPMCEAEYSQCHPNRHETVAMAQLYHAGKVWSLKIENRSSASTG